jgi:hypothetical protein
MDPGVIGQQVIGLLQQQAGTGHQVFQQQHQQGGRPRIGGYKFNSTMGGVSVSVKSEDAQNSLKICEGEGDNEYIVTRHSQLYPAINIVNVYGCQKSVPVATIEDLSPELIQLIRIENLC